MSFFYIAIYFIFLPYVFRTENGAFVELLDLKNIISRQYFFPVMVLPYEFCVSHETMNLQEVSLSDYQKEKPDNGGQNGTNYRRS